MELNVSSFYETDENNQNKAQLNSTVADNELNSSNRERGNKEWFVSPIIADDARQSIFKGQSNEKKSNGANIFKSPPLKVLNGSKTNDEGYDSKETDAEKDKNSSKNNSLKLSPQVASFIESKNLNRFDSIFLASAHKSLNFSPRLMFPQESSSTSGGERFQWSIEQLAILKPAEITDEEIAASYHSPIPEVEEKIQEAINEYWSKNVSYIPSPDGPRHVYLPDREGNITTIVYGSDGCVSGLKLREDGSSTTPSLCNMVRKKEAMKSAYATSSPKQRRKKSNIKTMRSRQSQTKLTFPSNMDLEDVFGKQCIYESNGEEEENNDIFNVSISSNQSMRRRLFCQNDDDDANVSMNSCDNLNDSQRFNDSLSPVPRDEQDEYQPPSTTNSPSSNTHASQLAINVSILNDCMMQSINDEPEEEELKPEQEHESPGPSSVFEHQIKCSEFELHDELNTNATPRREDLDWTPRRVNTEGNLISNQEGRFRNFFYEMSPINGLRNMTPNGK